MDVRLQGTFTLQSPLSHIGESISATSYLVEEPILQPGGTVEHVFVYSGNAWRGQLRDLSAAYMLDSLGAPKLPLEMFHLLFAGGKIGGAQSTNIEQARQLRRGIPHIALLGGGSGNQILAGKTRVRNCYPLVMEAIPALAPRYREQANATSYRAITFEKSFSRMDDAKDERLTPHLLEGPSQPQALALMPGDDDAKPGKAPKGESKDGPAQQMRMTVELVAPGTVLSTAIDVIDCSEIELGCLTAALHRFARAPYIGGQSNRGHGLVALHYDLLNMDTGEVVPFLDVEDGIALLEAPAREAKGRYDDYLESVYQTYLDSHGGEVMGLLGAKAG